VLPHARQVHGKRIEHIHIVMGERSTSIDDSIRFYWSMIASRTMAGESRLHFRRVPAQDELRIAVEDDDIATSIDADRAEAPRYLSRSIPAANATLMPGSIG